MWTLPRLTLTIIFLLAFSPHNLISSLPDKHYPQQSEILGNPVLLDQDQSPSYSAKLLLKTPQESEMGSEMESDQEELVSSPNPLEDLNSTESPSPPPPPASSEAPPSSSTTTTEQPIVVAGEGKSTKGYFCLCDLHVAECDMNCCCDLDCSDEEKKTFTSCTGSTIYDPKHRQNKEYSCVKSYLLYLQNSPHRVDRTEKNLFCIVKENAKQEREFSQKDMSRIVKSISRGKIDARPKYGWGHLHWNNDIQISSRPYKYGSAIWTRRLIESEEEISYHEEMFQLPASFITQTCSINEPVRYLENSVSSCILKVEKLRCQCETLSSLNSNFFVKNFSIISNPEKKAPNSTYYPIQSVIPAVACHHDLDHCEEYVHELSLHETGSSSGGFEDIEFPTPVLTTDKQFCLNVLLGLNLTFVHEGTEGITHVIAKVIFDDVPVEATEIRQQFNVNFIWNSEHKVKPEAAGKDDTNQNQTAPTVEEILASKRLPRSGNPGYLVGKPLIVGRKVTTTINAVNESTSGNKKIEKVHVDPDSVHWLQIQGPGDCPVDSEQINNFSRETILFGYEHVTSCNLPLKHFRYCEQLQKHVSSVLFGEDEDPQHFINSPLQVAAYGSPDAFPSDWVPLSFKEISPLLWGFTGSLVPSSSLITRGCDRITTAVHVTIAYAYVGPVDAPQAKITGVFYEPEEAIQIPIANTDDKGETNKKKDLTVTTTVSFVDVTGKPTTRVATWPVLSVQLPSDFYYPFSSSAAIIPSSGAETTGKSYFTTSFTFAILFIGVLLIV